MPRARIRAQVGDLDARDVVALGTKHQRAGQILKLLTAQGPRTREENPQEDIFQSPVLVPPARFRDERKARLVFEPQEMMDAIHHGFEGQVVTIHGLRSVAITMLLLAHR